MNNLAEVAPDMVQIFLPFGSQKTRDHSRVFCFDYLCTMKSTIIKVLGGMAILMAAAACNNQGKCLKTETFSASDTTAHSSFIMKAELPAGKDAASENIRRELISVMDSQLAFIGSYEGDRVFPAFEGEGSNEAIFNYYKDNAAKRLRDLGGEDAAERAEYFDGEIPGWEYEFSLTKIADTLGYIIFQNLDYVYTGGAHGGMVGQGDICFDRETGERIKILKDDVADAMQPLLVKGLISYFSDYGEQMTEESLMEHLMLWETTQIPLPGWDPRPSADGLSFTYQQYEIASYADGMPNFTIPYEDVAPYLTPQAKKVLDMHQP